MDLMKPSILGPHAPPKLAVPQMHVRVRPGAALGSFRRARVRAMMTAPGVTRAVIAPGNGGGPTGIRDANFYGWVADALQAGGMDAVVRDMPDPYVASEKVWVPFLRDTLRCGADTVLVGHSSGAAAGLRLAEEVRLGGLVLVSAYATDLGDAMERQAGYFTRPFDWDKIRANCGFVVQFGSPDDPFLPWDAQCEVAEGLGITITRLDGRGHFMEPTFPELVNAIQARASSARPRE